jgi:hypothetical protein
MFWNPQVYRFRDHFLNFKPCFRTTLRALPICRRCDGTTGSFVPIAKWLKTPSALPTGPEFYAAASAVATLP